MNEIYLGGSFIEMGESLDVNNPFNGAFIDRCGKAGQKEIDKAIVLAQQAGAELMKLASVQRYEILHGISNGLLNERKRLAELLAGECAKPLRYAMGEIDRAADTFQVAAEESKRLPREYIALDWTAAGKGKEGWVRYFPAGIVVAITPFNFPLNLVAHKVAPAIAAGCPIILKPASAAPLCSLELAKIIDQTALPKGAFSVLPCDRHVGDFLIADSRVAVLSFTGSPEVGWAMKERAGKKKVVLELGGNAGVLIAGDADLDHAVNRCLMGGFAYSGQVCIHVQRIFVVNGLFEAFCERFLSRVKALKYGDPLDENTEISCMIDEKNAVRVETWVERAITGGARLLQGGRRDGTYYPPTVLTGTNRTMEVNGEEVFGPVVVVEKVDSISEGIRHLNDTRFGLQAGLFTFDMRSIRKAFEEVEVGGLIINDVPTFRVDHMPYGGIKDSGFGREGVKYAIRDYMEAKILVL
ncbi:MAG: aldehyde dehydrogenase family protein [Deltaproteobacteria bacterium]|nr:aldehyde dehydrogenase family protein [Deltaproteobacteria bacterium]